MIEENYLKGGKTHERTGGGGRSETLFHSDAQLAESKECLRGKNGSGYEREGRRRVLTLCSTPMPTADQLQQRLFEWQQVPRLLQQNVVFPPCGQRAQPCMLPLP